MSSYQELVYSCCEALENDMQELKGKVPKSNADDKVQKAINDLNSEITGFNNSLRETKHEDKEIDTYKTRQHFQDEFYRLGGLDFYNQGLKNIDAFLQHLLILDSDQELINRMISKNQADGKKIKYTVKEIEKNKVKLEISQTLENGSFVKELLYERIASFTQHDGGYPVAEIEYKKFPDPTKQKDTTFPLSPIPEDSPLEPFTVKTPFTPAMPLNVKALKNSIDSSGMSLEKIFDGETLKVFNAIKNTGEVNMQDINKDSLVAKEGIETIDVFLANQLIEKLKKILEPAPVTPAAPKRRTLLKDSLGKINVFTPLAGITFCNDSSLNGGTPKKYSRLTTLDQTQFSKTKEFNFQRFTILSIIVGFVLLSTGLYLPFIVNAISGNVILDLKNMLLASSYTGKFANYYVIESIILLTVGFCALCSIIGLSVQASKLCCCSDEFDLDAGKSCYGGNVNTSGQSIGPTP